MVGMNVEWIFVALVVITAMAIMIHRGSKRKTRSRGLSRQVVSGGVPQSTPSIRKVSALLPATELLSRAQILQHQQAQWDEILAELNPTGHPEVQQLLIDIRGPHMFVPHVALGVIEDGCDRVLALNPKADALAALREALEGRSLLFGTNRVLIKCQL